MSTRPRTRSRLAAVKLASGAAVVALACLSAPGVSAAPKPTPTPPQLSIAVDNGRTSAAPGDKLSYVITLTNVGAKDVSDLWVTQSLPTGTSLLAADAAGDKLPGVVQWKVDLKATKQATFRTSIKLADTPEEVLRLASVVCAKVSAKAAPVVCASDSDLLPAGAAAAKTAQQVGTEPPDRTAWYAAGGVALTALLSTLLVLRFRRRTPVSEPSRQAL